MHRKFIATIAAASILVTGFAAAPARADQDDLGRALAVLLGVAVVGAVIHENKKDKRKETRVKKKPHHKVHKPVQKRSNVQPRPLPRRVSEHLLPGNCLRSFETRRGPARIFHQRCLERSYGFTHRLPQHCATRVRTDRGSHVGFSARCLRKRGYQLARH